MAIGPRTIVIDLSLISTIIVEIRKELSMQKKYEFNHG